MATIPELRSAFEKMNTAQKREFVVSVKKQLQQGRPAPEQTRFLNECITIYNAEVKAKKTPASSAVHSEPNAASGGKSAGTAALQAADVAKQATATLKSGFSKAKKTINKMAGEEGDVKLSLRDLFSDVFKKHSTAQSEEIFVAGTLRTMPLESEIVTSWPRPWLFSRVFTTLFVSFLMLYLMANNFQNTNALPGLMFIGALALPFSVMIFVFETNAPRNISIFDVIKMFFIGGVSSLIFSLILFELIPTGEIDYWTALLVGIIEETGKLAAVAIFVRMLNPKYILNGLLIGSAIGAGFAVFETAGYAFNYFVYSGFSIDVLIDILFVRGWSSLGGHVVWAAISGAALVSVKGEEPLKVNAFFNRRFFPLFSIPIALHALWNSPLLAQGVEYKLVVLIIIAWTFVLILLSAGLKQIERKTNQLS